MYKEKYGFSEPPKQLQDAFARVGIQYKVQDVQVLCLAIQTNINELMS